jgi:transcription initiation factor TFIID subunit 13
MVTDHIKCFVLDVTRVRHFRFQTIKTMELNKQNKVHVEDLMYLLRKDPRKYARAKDLILMNQELKKARKAFEEANKY